MLLIITTCIIVLVFVLLPRICRYLNSFNRWSALSTCHFRNTPQTITPTVSSVQGTLPAWLTGILYRIGPGKYHLEGKKTFVIRHAFDGMPFMHRFEFSSESIRYSSRHLSEAVEKQLTENRPDKVLFGHSQTLTPWERIKHIVGRVNALLIQGGHFDNKDPSSEMVGVTATPNYPVPHGANEERVLVAKTDANLLQQVDADTLIPKRLFNYASLDKRLDGELSAAHHQYDPVTGEIFNFTLKLMPPRLQVFVTTRTGEVHVLANISRHNGKSIRPAYIHSFWLTKNYVIIPESPLYFHAIDFLVGGTAVSGLHWDRSRPTYLHVIGRRPDQGHITTIEVEPFYTFHTANAWDSMDEDEPVITMDCAAFPDGDIIYQLQTFGNPLRKPQPSFDQVQTVKPNGITMHPKRQNTFGDMRRYRIWLRSERSRYDVLARNVEFPRFNQNLALKPYRYVYCCEMQPVDTYKTETYGLVKLDLNDGSTYKYEQDGFCCSEPIFVPNPNGVDEDDGVVLSFVNVIDRQASEHDRSILMILDAKDMKELARCDIGSFTAVTFHGSYVNHDFENISIN
ncbi:hypothetical protein EC973_000842 [Apophysomyces ossiformis]|uniref:Carotenoid oxygenase n=1 Tax=Apophysomyces ossiformis TaxID=679940 RepID=A0A8H7ESC8_9FUNG|nr:hypothetical protein EC973_000842 [Apophysomyces ossiformis]